MSLPGRDSGAIEALVTDRYLDALLAAADDPDARDGHDGGLDRPPGRDGPGRLDRAVRLASERLTRDLPRFHPSFRFEERLALRLAAAAAAMRAPAVAGGGEAAVVPLWPGRPVEDPGLLGLIDDPEDERVVPRISRPLLVGGAVAASALSLAGAALVAWRRTRGAGPMTRAVRAAHALRPAGEGSGQMEGAGR